MSHYRILAFGDSLTWGFNAEHGSRYDDDVRWPRVLETTLGPSFTVIEEGLVARRIASEDPLRPFRNSLSYFSMFLESHKPLDLVIIMLGSNDCGRINNLTPYDIASAMQTLANKVLQYPVEKNMRQPKVMIVSPPHIRPSDNFHNDVKYRMEGAYEKSQALSHFYARMAVEIGAGFFDAATVASTHTYDGLHLDAENTKALGRGIAPFVAAMLAAA